MPEKEYKKGGIRSMVSKEAFDTPNFMDVYGKLNKHPDEIFHYITFKDSGYRMNIYTCESLNFIPRGISCTCPQDAFSMADALIRLEKLNPHLELKHHYTGWTSEDFMTNQVTMELHFKIKNQTT